jgi:NAD(P)H-quinone oxidoreductase subunit 5
LTWISWLPALAPLAYLAAALAPERRFPVLGMSRLAAVVALLGAAAAAGCAMTPAGSGAVLAIAPGVAVSLRLDGLSAVLTGLIAFIGMIVVLYSRNYLAGDPRQGAFIRGLCLTLGFVLGLVMSGNLLQLVACWIGASVAANRLLLFRAERQAAVLAARKRFLVARIADLCLIAAAIILWRTAGSLDIGRVLAAARSGGAESGAAAVLLALAAVFSSAQLPFHGWILEVMETPTPVSALMHAGVVNAGGFLVLRFSDLMAAHPAAMMLLAAVGGLTAIFGSLVMLTQTSVKVGLAYSTIAQMGFMLLECGLGAFSGALLHIVAHALYKAHAFLSAGGAAGGKATTPERPASMATVLAAPLLAVVGAAAATALGVGPDRQPGAFVLSAVLLMGLARLWLRRTPRAPGLSLALATIAVIAAYGAAQKLFSLITPHAPAPPSSALATAIAVAIPALMTALVCLQLRLPGPARSPAWARAYAVVSNGFYLNTLANRWVLRAWPAPPASPTQHGAA